MSEEDKVLRFKPNLNINRHLSPKEDTFNYTYICRDDEKILLKDLWEEHKQLPRLQAENELLKEENKKLKYFLDKIRDDELYSLDVEWDEYITECGCTEYSNIITFVELALGERNE